MATLREIRRRIAGVKSTQKITKAMKMVAAAKLRRAQEAVIAARPYARALRDLLQHIASRVDVSSHPLFMIRPVGRVLVVIVTSDRGLSGAFNANIIRTSVHHIAANYQTYLQMGNVDCLCIGRKGADFMKKNGYNVLRKEAGVRGQISFDAAGSIADGIAREFLDGQYDRVDVIYNEFKSIIQQRVVIEELLPIPRASVASAEEKVLKPVNYIYEPSKDRILEELVPRHFRFRLWHILLESNAAEQGARMTAMDNATTNASELIDSLQLSYNKARQASITKELLEIVSGAEALKGSD